MPRAARAAVAAPLLPPPLHEAQYVCHGSCCIWDNARVLRQHRTALLVQGQGEQRCMQAHAISSPCNRQHGVQAHYAIQNLLQVIGRNYQ